MRKVDFFRFRINNMCSVIIDNIVKPEWSPYSGPASRVIYLYLIGS